MAAVELTARTYRVLDVASKLAGVGLVAIGLEVGGDTGVGIALAAVGVALGTATVFTRRHQ